MMFFLKKFEVRTKMEVKSPFLVSKLEVLETIFSSAIKIFSALAAGEKFSKIFEIFGKI